MPRHRRRLTRKTLTAAEIDIYADYLKGNRKHQVPRKAPAAYRETTAARLIPFGLSPSGANFTRVSVTRGALGILNTLAIANIDGIFGLNLTEGAIKEVEFYPAVARITLRAPNVTPITAGTSAFTGRPRNYKPGRSGSVPFGRGSTAAQPDVQNPTTAQGGVEDIDYMDAVAAIKKAISASSYAGAKSVSFEPEIFRSDREATGFGKAPVAPVF